MMRSFRLHLLVLLLPLTACGIGQRTADDLYVLKADHVAHMRNTLPVNISIADPEMAPGLDTQNIAVIDSPNHLTYYTGAAWAQPLPQLLQQFMLDSFQQSGVFKNVSTDQDELIPDVTLLTDIRDYEVDTNLPGPTVRIRLIATLVSTANHKSIASFTIEKTAISDANHMTNIVAAFNRAMNDATADILKGIKAKYRK